MCAALPLRILLTNEPQIDLVNQRRWLQGMVRSFILQDTFVVVRAEIFNKRDEVQETFGAGRVEKVSGYWTVMEMKMADNLERTRTELVLEKVEYNVGLKPDDLSRRELERGGGDQP